MLAEGRPKGQKHPEPQSGVSCLEVRASNMKTRKAPPKKTEAFRVPNLGLQVSLGRVAAYQNLTADPALAK